MWIGQGQAAGEVVSNMPEIGNSNEKQKTVLTRLVVARKLLINLLSNISSSFGRRNAVFQHDDKMNCNIFFAQSKTNL